MILFFSTLWAQSPGDVAPSRRHLSPSARHKKKTVSPAKPVSVLARGRWLPDVKQALEQLIRREGNKSAGYSAANPPSAVIVFDDVAAAHNPGELLFQDLVDQVLFKFGNDFWPLLPLQYGEENIRAYYGDFIREPRVTWNKNPYYAMYRKTFYGSYQSICREQGRSACARYLATLLYGFQEEEVQKLAAESILRSLRGEFGEKSVGNDDVDPSAIRVRVGLRKIPEMENLISQLKLNGFDVWLVSTANQWSASAGAALYDIDPKHVVGVQVRVDSGTVTQEALDPIPFASGAAEAVLANVGRSPSLIISGAEDVALLRLGKGVKILIGAPSSEVMEKGWFIQPRFW